MPDLLPAPLDRQIALDNLRMTRITKQPLRDDGLGPLRGIQPRRIVVDRPPVDEDVVEQIEAGVCADHAEMIVERVMLSLARLGHQVGDIDTDGVDAMDSGRHTFD